MGKKGFLVECNAQCMAGIDACCSGERSANHMFKLYWSKVGFPTGAAPQAAFAKKPTQTRQNPFYINCNTCYSNIILVVMSCSI